VSETEYTHFKHFIEKLNRARTTTWKRNCRSFAHDTHRPFYGRNHASNVWERFLGILIPGEHFASTKGSWGRSKVKWRKVGKNFLSSCFIWWKLCSLFIFSTKMFKMSTLFLGHSVYAYLFLHVHGRLSLQESANVNFKVRADGKICIADKVDWKRYLFTKEGRILKRGCILDIKKTLSTTEGQVCPAK
jgi:hypothetical protein